MQNATLSHVVKAAAQERYHTIDATHVGALKKKRIAAALRCVVVAMAVEMAVAVAMVVVVAMQ
jgi:hypothetical protein